MSTSFSCTWFKGQLSHRSELCQEVVWNQTEFVNSSLNWMISALIYSMRSFLLRSILIMTVSRKNWVRTSRTFWKMLIRAAYSSTSPSQSNLFLLVNLYYKQGSLGWLVIPKLIQDLFQRRTDVLRSEHSAQNEPRSSLDTDVFR